MKEIKTNFKNEYNLLFSKKINNNLGSNYNFSSKNSNDILANTFTLKDTNLILKSYLINNKKDINIFSYKNLIKDNIMNNKLYKNTIYNDLGNSIQYISPLINNFEESLIKELNKNLIQNVLLVNSNKNWIIVFINNKENRLLLREFEKIKDFNKYSLKKEDIVYSIYSKDILEDQGNIVKRLTYGDIFVMESEKLFFLSNNLINDEYINMISNKFFNFKNQRNHNDFLFKIIDIQDSDSLNNEILSILINRLWFKI